MHTHTRGIILPSKPCASGSEILDLMPILNPFLNTSQRERRKLFQIKRAKHMKKKSHMWGRLWLQRCIKCCRGLCEGCSVLQSVLSFWWSIRWRPDHYRLCGVIHRLSYMPNSHWAMPAWPTHVPHLAAQLYLSHSLLSILKRPIAQSHQHRTAMFDLRLAFSSKGRDFPLPFSLWNSLFKERYQESNVNYFIILEVMIREKTLIQTEVKYWSGFVRQTQWL